MSVILIIPNDDVNRGEKTKVATTQSVVSDTLIVENTEGLSVDDFICIGRENMETAELMQIKSIASDQKTITLTVATKFIHKQYEEVTKFYYNQRKIYRKLSTESAYTILGTETIEVDRPDGTLYQDTSGVATALYKATYYNSTTIIETSLTDAKASYGGGGTHFADLSDIREEAGFDNNDDITDQRLFRHRERAEGEISASLIARYSMPITDNSYWSNSAAQELIRQIVMLLGAGWLLWQEYPDERGSGTSNDGLAKIKEARSMLKDIRNGNLMLLGSDNNPLSQLDTQSIEGYPDNSFSTIPDENHDDDDNYIFQLGKSW